MMRVAWRQNVILEDRPVTTALRAVRWLAHCLLRMPAFIDIERGGPRMQLKPYLYRYGSTSLYMKRIEYEPTLAFLASLVRPGDILLDVGANFGVYSLLLAKRAGKTGKCYSFEPGAEALAQLRSNIARNPEFNIEVVPLALSDSEGTGHLFHTGGPTTFNMGGGDLQDCEVIATTTLDLWMSGSPTRRVDLVKIDIEGHEPAAFKGGRQTLSRHRPIIMFEVSQDALQRGGGAIDSSWAVLAELGYEMYRLDHHQLVPLAAVEEGNLFAVHPDSEKIDRVAPYLKT